MNEDLLQVRNRCLGNRLLLNPDKTKLIVFGSRQMASKLHEFHLSFVRKGHFLSVISERSWRDFGSELNI